MPRANRSNKGNRKRGVFDRTVVPKNAFQLHVDPPAAFRPDLPEQEVGQKCTIQNVIIYEVSASYEGKPQTFIKRIKFADIVGNPVSTEQLNKGYMFETPQGEKLLVKWHLGTSNELGGLIVHNRGAKGTSYFEPNWGQVFGVGMEWLSCDGTEGGIIWANRHLGNTTGAEMADGSYDFKTTLFNSGSAKDYSPNAVRPGLMLGNPEPDRALWVMGSQLPFRVYPALGRLHQGCVFGFNRNVMKFVQVAPALATYLTVTGMTTSRADQIQIQFAKDMFHDKNVCLGIEVENHPLVRQIQFGNRQAGGLHIAGNWAATVRAGTAPGMVYFNTGAGEVRLRVYLLECDASGNPQYTLMKSQYVWQWPDSTGGTSEQQITEAYNGTLPFPEKGVQLCAGESSGTPATGGGGTEQPSNLAFGYFCDGSTPAGSIVTDYWQDGKALSSSVAAAVQSQYGVTIRKPFWEGRNDWLTLFGKIDSSSPYSKSKITPTDFHAFLSKMLMEVKAQIAEPMEAQSFSEFKAWCESAGLSCLTDLQKASFYMTYLLQTPVNFFSSAAGYLEGTILDVMAANLLLLPKGLADWIDFNDIVVDSGGSITGAFAADIPDAQFKAFSSFLNFEPQALQYTADSAIAHRPYDYVKPSGAQWGSATAVDWKSYWLPEMTDANYKPFAAAEVGIHEMGHAVAYHGIDIYGTAVHSRPDWLAISGWSAAAPSKSPNDVSAHLVKTRPATQTGGLPKTDSGKEAPVSDYGCFHPAEDFAEAFRLYTLNPVFLEQKYPQKYKFMVDVIEPMFA